MIFSGEGLARSNGPTPMPCLSNIKLLKYNIMSGRFYLKTLNTVYALKFVDTIPY
jgi:hypothetical protein